MKTRGLSIPALRWGGRGLIWGISGLVILIWLLNTPPGLLGKADAIGYAVCHRVDLRSFHLGERALPLCIRCSGMYLGAMLGLAYHRWVGRGGVGLPPRRVWLVFGAFVLAFAVDGLNSYLHFFPGVRGLYPPHHALRLLTGTGMGLTLSAILYPSFGQTVWQRWNPQPVFQDLRSLMPLLGLALLLDGLVWTQNPLILYPLALLSAVGVVIVLTIVYALLFVVVFHQENRAQRASQLILPLVAGLGLAFVQIGVFDWLRFLLTGTWDGFQFG